jgi:hypothetical protein
MLFLALNCMARKSMEKTLRPEMARSSLAMLYFFKPFVITIFLRCQGFSLFLLGPAALPQQLISCYFRVLPLNLLRRDGTDPIPLRHHAIISYEL